MGLLDINLQNKPISEDYLLNKKFIIYDSPLLRTYCRAMHVYTKDSLSRIITTITFKYCFPNKRLHVIIPKYMYWKDHTGLAGSRYAHIIPGTNGKISLIDPCSPAKQFYDELQDIDNWISEEVLLFQKVQHESDLELYIDVITQKALKYGLCVSKI